MHFGPWVWSAFASDRAAGMDDGQASSVAAIANIRRGRQGNARAGIAGGGGATAIHIDNVNLGDASPAIKYVKENWDTLDPEFKEFADIVLTMPDSGRVTRAGGGGGGGGGAGVGWVKMNSKVVDEFAGWDSKQTATVKHP